MRKDLYVYYAKSIPEVFDAYYKAIKTKFNKVSETKPYYHLCFPLNYSFRYSMNGGVCNIHFVPYKDGTAVNIHYTIVQLGGASCKKHARHMNEEVEKILGVSCEETDINPSKFSL